MREIQQHIDKLPDVHCADRNCIVFNDGGNAINTAILNAEGDAEFNAPFAIGAHSVTAAYNGDAPHQASTAAAVTFTVVKDTPDVYIGASNITSSNPFTLAGGQDSHFNILVEQQCEDTIVANEQSPAYHLRWSQRHGASPSPVFPVAARRSILWPGLIPLPDRRSASRS